MRILKPIIVIVSVSAAFFLFSHALPENKIQQDTVKKTGQTGQELFAKYCLACHQADGNGVRGMFPPLAGNEKITGPAKDIIPIVLFGLTGPVEVKGKTYDQVMPPQDYLQDNQIADILTYVRSSWGNKAPAVKAEDVAAVRKKGKVK